MSAFIWDFDGVIANTPHEEAWAEACKIYNIEGFNHEFYEKYVSGLPRSVGGLNILEKLGYLNKSIEDKNKLIKEFTDLKTKIYLKMIEQGKYSLNKGIIEFIIRSRKLGIVQVLASASKNVLKIATREEAMPGVKIIEIFDLDLSGSAETKEEIFRNAMKEVIRLGKNKCIVFFEDAPRGIQIAKSLGAIAVGCFYEMLREYGADYVIKDFTLIKPEDLLGALGCEK